MSRASGKKRSDFAYQAVYRYLVSLINTADGHVRVKLPSLRLLAERLNVSISTIQYALPLRIVNDYVKNSENLLNPYSY